MAVARQPMSIWMLTCLNDLMPAGVVLQAVTATYLGTVFHMPQRHSGTVKQSLQRVKGSLVKCSSRRSLPCSLGQALFVPLDAD